MKQRHSIYLSKKLFAVLILLVFLTCDALGQDRSERTDVSLYNDPRIKQWSKDFLKGKREDVIKAVEQDLLSGSPHPFSTHIWVTTQESFGQLREIWTGQRNPALREALGELPDIYLFYKGHEYKKILKEYPLSRAEKISDLYALNYLMWAAINEYHYKDAKSYAEIMIRLRPDFFQAAWSAVNIAEYDERMRSQIRSLAYSDKQLKDTIFARFFLQMEGTRPLNEDIMVESAEAWLTESPFDARALRFLGIHFSGLGKYQEALEAYRKSTALYPFLLQNWSDEANLLVKMGRKEEAQAAIDRDAVLGSKDLSEAAPLIKKRMVSTLNDAKARDKARVMLEAANQEWPEHFELNIERAELELKSDRPRDALAYARKAADLKPDDFDAQLLLMKVFTKLRDYKSAADILERIDSQNSQKNISFFHQASDILDKSGRTKDKIDLWQRASKEFPDSDTVIQNWAASLAENGRLEEAIDKYRESFDISVPDPGILTKYIEMIRNEDGFTKAIRELDDLMIRFPWESSIRLLSAEAESKIPFSLPSPAKSTNTASLFAQVGHPNGVTSAALSPDKRFVFTGGADGTAFLWETKTGRIIRRFDGHEGSVSSAVFSEEGKFVLTGCSDGSVRLWDVNTGQTLRKFQADSTPISSVALSKDGRLVLTGGATTRARLWDMETGKEVRRLEGAQPVSSSIGAIDIEKSRSEGHSGSVNAVAFSPDDRMALTGSSDKTARLWDIKTGMQLKVLYGHKDSINSVAFAPDGKLILTGGFDGTARLWHIASGLEIQRFDIRSEVWSVAFAPDGKSIVTGSNDGTPRIWDIETATPLSFIGHKSDVRSVVFSKDGQYLLTGSFDGTGCMWDIAKGKPVQCFEGLSVLQPEIVFSPDGRYVAIAGTDNAAHLWDLNTGQEILSLGGHESRVSTIAFSQSGRLIATGSDDRSVKLWDVYERKEIQRIGQLSDQVRYVSFSPDEKYLLSVQKDNTAGLYETSGGRQTGAFRGLSDWANSAAFSPDGKSIITGGDDSIVRMWETDTGKEMRRFTGHAGEVYTVNFSPVDGQLIITGGADRTVRLWNASDSSQIFSLPEHDGAVVAAAFSPDGLSIATGGVGSAPRLWDTKSGKEKKRFKSGSKDVDSLAFSPNGKFLIARSIDHIVHVWDVESGKEVKSFAGQSENVVRASSFSKDDRFLILSNRDNTVSLIGTSDWKELCRLVSFTDGTWAVVAPEGRYDASNSGDIKGIYWVVRDEPIILSQLKMYYHPYLLSRIMGYNPEPLKDVTAFKEVKLFPEVIIEPTSDSTKFKIHLKNRGGGIGKIVVKVNGNRLLADARGPIDADADNIEIPVDISGASIIPGEENSIEVKVSNKDGYLSSDENVEQFKAPEIKDPEPPDIYIIVAGVSTYARTEDNTMNLKFSGKDAYDISEALKIAALRYFKSDDKVHLTLLTDYKGAKDAYPPSRENIENAFKDISQKAKSTDVLVIYLAGHGVMAGTGDNADYYYLTKEAHSLILTSMHPSERRMSAISSAELTEWITQIHALKRVMILDTCAAGGVMKNIMAKRELPSSQILSIDQLRESTGFHILMGAASDASSLEATPYGQGLLTYSILEGIRGASLRDDEFLEIEKLFSHSEKKVPELAKYVGGIQKPFKAKPEGKNFDIGRLLKEDKERIHLEIIKPMIGRVNFVDKKEFDDEELNLTKLVKAELREMSFQTRGKGFIVYIDTDEFPGAYKVSGSYEKSGDQVIAEVKLIKDAKKDLFKVEGIASDLPAFAKKIAEDITNRLLAKK